MEERTKQAYRLILSAGMLHLKWDLACWQTGIDVWNWRRQAESARRASLRAFAFHNLAIFAARDFCGFSEDSFWKEVDRFHSDCPESLCPYREMFEQCLRGDPIEIIAPDGIGGA